MKSKNCPICNTLFSKYSIFCSKNCYYKSRKNAFRTEEHKLKNKLSLINYYNSSQWLLDKEERGKKISNSNKKYYNTEEKEKLLIYLKEGYISNSNILNSVITKRVSSKALKNTIDEDNNLKELYSKRLKFIPNKIQNFTLEEWYEFKKCFSQQNITEFCENFKLNDKTYKRIQNYFKFIPRKYTRKKETKPEKIVRELLDVYDIKYEQEYNYKSWRIDFFIKPNIFIEVQGDYWHGNPKFYCEHNFNNIQKKHIVRDYLKKQDILNSQYLFIEIWESDIKTYNLKIKKLFSIIKNGRFNRKFYSTSSW